MAHQRKGTEGISDPGDNAQPLDYKEQFQVAAAQLERISKDNLNYFLP